MKLSVVVNTKNAEKTLERTLKSVKFADEIIVVDMKSDDKTVQIAKKHTSKVFNHKDVGYVEPARNFALSKAGGDWILVLDADEEVSPELANFVERIVSDQINDAFKADCYYVARKNIIFGKWVKHTGWWPDYMLRLFKNGHVEWDDQIHSVPITKGVVKEIPAKEELALIHHNYQSIDQFINRLNRYTSIQALHQNNPSLHDASDTQAGAVLEAFTTEFLSRLFAYRGIDDGIHGMSLSLLQSMSEVVNAMKQWQLSGFKPTHSSGSDTVAQLRKFQKDMNYWIADWHVSKSRGWQKFYWRVRRKMRW